MKRQREKSDSDGEEVEMFSVLVEIVEAALKPFKKIFQAIVMP